MNAPQLPPHQQEAQRQPHPIVLYRQQVNERVQEFGKVLPPTIRPDEFARVAITAVQVDPPLLKADRHSLLTALMRAAEDHLLPDGREGALVVYGNTVQWQPMVEGVRKRLFNEGGIILDTGVVYAHDIWEYERGDVPRIKHCPRPGPRSRTDLVAVYSIARLKDGRILSRDWMWKEEVEQIRNEYSRGKNGPAWNNDASYPEMAIKTVVHHHSKSLPVSTEFRDMVNRPEFWDGAAEPAEQRAIEPSQTISSFPQMSIPNRTQLPMDQLQSLPPRTVEGVMSAMANGEQVEQPKRRRRTKAEMEAERAAAQQTTVGHHPTGPMHTNGPGEGPVQQPSQQVTDGEFDPETGEVYEDEPATQNSSTNSASEIPDIPDFLQRKPEPVDPVKAHLVLMMKASQPANKGEYLGFMQAQWEYAGADASKQEAVRQYWGQTGGMRTQFGVTQDDIKELTARMRRQ